jgi:DNA-binding YbaB/EbfC family protein
MFGNLGNLGNLAGMMKNLKTIQDNIRKAQAEMAQFEGAGTSEDGSVTVVCGGDFQIKRITIVPDSQSPGRDLERAVSEAVNHAIAIVKEHSRQRITEATGGIDIPGLVS